MSGIGGFSSSEYDQHWDEWGDMRAFGPASRHLRRLIAAAMKRIDPPKSVLDVGCGRGDLLLDVLAIHPNVQTICGVDISQVGLTTAHKRLGKGEFRTLDISAEALPEKYDLVLCTDVVEHIIDDIAALRNLAKMTRGHLIVTTLQGHMRPVEADVGHVRNYAIGELADKARQAGLREVHRFEWGFPFYSPIYRDILNGVGGRGTTGKFGPSRRIVSELIYQVFRLNAWQKGDYVVATFRPE